MNIFDNKGIVNFIDWYSVIQHWENKYNFVNEMWDFLFHFNIEAIDWVSWNKILKIRTKNGYNFLDKKGIFLFDFWFSDISEFKNNLAIVDFDNKQNIVNNEWKLFLNVWYESVTFLWKYIKLKENWKYNLIDKQHKKYIFDEWYDNIDSANTWLVENSSYWEYSSSTDTGTKNFLVVNNWESKIINLWSKNTKKFYFKPHIASEDYGL